MSGKGALSQVHSKRVFLYATMLDCGHHVPLQARDACWTLVRHEWCQWLLTPTLLGSRQGNHMVRPP